MASAPTKIGNGQLPAGFVSPFKRVPMQGTHDDMLACAATLCGKSLEDVKKMAVTLGMRANGPFHMDESLFRKILFNLSDLACSDYKDFTKIDALPNVAVLCGAFSKFDESCRHVVFHHVKGTDKFQSFSYLLDPAPWLDPKFHITTDFSQFSLEPQAWYMEITQRPSPTGVKQKVNGACMSTRTTALRPLRDLLTRLPLLPITSTQQIDFPAADARLLVAIRDDAETTIQVMHRGISVIGDLLGHSAVPIEDGTISSA